MGCEWRNAFHQTIDIRRHLTISKPVLRFSLSPPDER
jgi:hypothetical protein